MTARFLQEIGSKSNPCPALRGSRSSPRDNVPQGDPSGGGWLVTRHHGCSADVRRCTSAGWSALVQSGLLSGDERGEVVESGGPPGLGVIAAGGVGPVAERHPRLGAVVVEFHARDRGLVHSHLGHRVGA